MTSYKELIRKICQYYDVDMAQLLSNRRGCVHICDTRNICIHAVKEVYGISSPSQLGKIFNRHHSSIKNIIDSGLPISYERFEKLLSTVLNTDRFAKIVTVPVKIIVKGENKSLGDNFRFMDYPSIGDTINIEKTNYTVIGKTHYMNNNQQDQINLLVEKVNARLE